MLKIILFGLLAAVAFAIHSAGGIAASKDKMMALFERSSATALGGSSDWG